MLLRGASIEVLVIIVFSIVLWFLDGLFFEFWRWISLFVQQPLPLLFLSVYRVELLCLLYIVNHKQTVLV